MEPKVLREFRLVGSVVHTVQMEARCNDFEVAFTDSDFLLLSFGLQRHK